MADHAPVMLWMSGRDGECDFFNRGWLDFTGRTMETEIGTGWAEGVHFEDFQNCMNVYLSSFVERKGFSMQYRLRRFDGEYRWVLDQGEPRFGPDGTFEGYIGSCIDITDLKEVEAKTQRVLVREQELRKQAEETNRLKDHFLATLSHELRTPLTSIIGWASLMRSRKLPEEIFSIAMEAIERNARAQARLVDDLLDISAITSTKFAFEWSEIRLRRFIQNAIHSIRPVASLKKITLTVNEPDGDVTFHGDADKLQQALGNVLSNAIKFTDEGGRIMIDIDSHPERVRIHVTDTGVGIAPDFLPHVFSPFRQADSSTTRKHGGLGLGLSITRHIVEMHGGSIRVFSGGLNQGASFTIEIPRKAVAFRQSG
jgi:PAS domain S-box-containing protein